VAPEQILFLALFLLVVLVNLVARWLRGRGERRPRVEAERPREIREGPRRVPPRPAVPTPEISRAPAPVAAPAPAPPAPVRRPPRFRLGGVADVRRGIMLMTVLGPCRALEPEDRGVAGAPGPR
jgi:hypothetical protein